MDSASENRVIPVYGDTKSGINFNSVLFYWLLSVGESHARFSAVRQSRKNDICPFFGTGSP